MIILNYYLILYKLIGVKSYAYFITLSIITIMCIITLDAISFLMDGMGAISAVKIMFQFPYFVVPAGIIFLSLMRMAPKRDFTYKIARGRQISFWPILISFIICFLSIGYNYAIKSKIFDVPTQPNYEKRSS
ncbi:MAG: hypothetical protein EBX41_06805 [Chitinophagia bacterium]|nr:hypothetical protein [Chitinophagia bacterium]